MQIVRVLVSSPGDVALERGRVQAIAAKLNREYEGLVSFETLLWEERFYKADRSFRKSSEKRQNYSSAALFSDISRKIIRLEQQCSFLPSVGYLKKSFSLFFGFSASGPTDTFFGVLMTPGGCFHYTLPSPAGGSVDHQALSHRRLAQNRCR